MKTAEELFNMSMMALHLEVSESIANDVRVKCEAYAKEHAIEFAQYTNKLRTARLSWDDWYKLWVTSPNNGDKK